MDLKEKLLLLLEKPICNHCLGRQFAQLLSGYTNKERGYALRHFAAMLYDSGETGMNMANFSDYKLYFTEKPKKGKKEKCSVCGNIFDMLDKWASKMINKIRNIEAKTFLIGTRPSDELQEKEEGLWEEVGIDYCEPLRAEINRELGKIIEKKTGLVADLKKPDINIILNLKENKVELQINPLFIYGEYQKLARGIPQTKWPSGKYRTSVEQIIAKPFMKATGGKRHKLHGMGREDIDARCLGWRPFVFEIIAPKKRNIDIKKLAKKIDEKKVIVRKIRFSDINEVRKIKDTRADKSYRATVHTAKDIKKNELKKLKQLVGIITQRTPVRVAHRRADLVRKRSVRNIKAKFLNRRNFMLEIRGEAGLYVKELITGDGGGTRPSVSDILGIPCECKELDVIKIHI